MKLFRQHFMAILGMLSLPVLFPLVFIFLSLRKAYGFTYEAMWPEADKDANT